MNPHRVFKPFKQKLESATGDDSRPPSGGLEIVFLDVLLSALDSACGLEVVQNLLVRLLRQKGDDDDEDA